MKRGMNNSIKLLLILLAIGFAAVSTTLFINGTLSFAANQDDFIIIFTYAELDDVDVSNEVISEDGKTITYTTKDLLKIGDFSKLEFEITNTSTQYDAEVSVNCAISQEYSDYYSVKKSIPNVIFARTVEAGSVRIELNRVSTETITENFTCTLTAEAIERTSAVSDPIKELNSYSMYGWIFSPYLPINMEQTLGYLDDLNVDTVYSVFNSEELQGEVVPEVIENIRNENKEVYYLAGDSGWYSKFSSVQKHIDMISDYNDSVSDNQKITGIVFDIEFYLEDSFNADEIAGVQTYANTVEQIYEYMNEKGLRTVLCIPYWLDEKFLDEADYTEDQIESVKQSLRKMFMNVDRISVMNYYKTYMVGGISYEAALAMELGIEIESIAEFARPDGDSIPETVTFWNEDDPLAAANERWQEVSDTYNYKKLGFSYHHIEVLFEIMGGYKNHEFELLLDGEAFTTTDRITVVYEDGSYDDVSSRSDAGINKNVSHEYRMENYDVVGVTETDIGDNTVRVTLNLKEKEKYTLEVYTKASDGISLTSGKITLQSLYFGDIYEAEITTDKYAIFRNVYTGTDYRVTVEDENGNVYTFLYGTGKDINGETVNITEGDVLFIPTGFDTDLYMGPSFYVE